MIRGGDGADSWWFQGEEDGVRVKAWAFSRGGEGSWLSIAAEMDLWDDDGELA